MRGEERAGRWQATGLGRSAAGSSQLHVYCTGNGHAGQTLLWLNGRRVASVGADHVLRRTLRRSRHLYRGLGEESWAFHVPVIVEAERIGAQAIEVHDADSGLRYRIDMATFTRRARAFTNAWGPQLALPLQLWRVVNPAPAAPVQLDLFGGRP